MINIDVFKITLSFLGSIIFGIIHGILFLAIEPILLKYVEEVQFFDESMAELTTSILTHCITLLLVYAIMYNINKKYELYENIFIDVVGILFGVSIVLIGYYLYTRYNNKNNNNNNNNKNNNNSKNNNNNSK